MFERRLGLHFDFHARPFEGMPPIGEHLKEADIREICRILRPDFIQIDCKGHPGWASYPSRLGNAMPVFLFDTMKLWRRVTREEGVKLFVHYSGVIDSNFCSKHPELAVMHADGSRDGSVTRTYGCRYADLLLIPQLKELAGEYGVDGAWIDGECWGTELDYDPETVGAFEAETGLKISARQLEKGTAEYIEFKKFCRKLFKEYVRHYTDEVHKAYPSFMITSNWMYSDYMPEPVSVGLDYLSGDFNPWNSVNTARLAGRALARQNKSWDLMSWNFRVDRDGYAKGRYVKHPVQIMQEAASVISLGGGFQNYITQYKDGSLRMEQIRRMREVFDMARNRQPWCYKGSIVPQIAVFLSENDRCAASQKVYARNGLEGTMGLISLLCDMGHGVSVASEFDYNKGFEVIAVPETLCSLGDAAKSLLDYARKGGNLILCGVKCVSEFIKAGLQIKLGAIAQAGRVYTLDGEAFATAFDSCTFDVESAENIAFSAEDARTERACFACIVHYGDGKIALFGSDIGLEHFSAKQAGQTDLLRVLLEHLYEPLVRLCSSEGIVEVTPLRKDGRLLIQLVNMNGPHSDTRTPSFDHIAPCRTVSLSVKLEKQPKAIIQRPEGKRLSFQWDGSRASFTVDRVEIHEIIEIEP